MLVCQWHLDLKYGAQGETVKVLRAWGQEKFASSDFRKATGARLMVGPVGASPSHGVDEYGFASLGGFEAALKGMGAESFRRHSDALAPFVAAGSQHWKVFRVLDE